MDDRVAYYQRVARALEAVLGDLGSKLTTSEVDEVRHFIDHNEFGLALHALTHLLVEERKAISPAVLARMEDLARTMGTDAELHDAFARIPVAEPGL